MTNRIPKPKRFPRVQRYPRPASAKGVEFIFKHKTMPIRYISYLNRIVAGYEFIYKPDYIILCINSDPKYPKGRKVKLCPRKVERKNEEDFPIFYYGPSASDRDPALFAELVALRESFIKKERAVSIRCPKEALTFVSLETCFSKCSKRCSQLDLNKMMGPYDEKSEYFQDLLKFQRLVNVLYGTARKEDHFNSTEDSDE